MTVHPIAWVIATEPNPYNPMYLFVTVACPLCAGRHEHGDKVTAYANDTMGHRVSHCGTSRDPGGYLLRRTTPEHAKALLEATTARCVSLTASGAQCTRKPRQGLGPALCSQHLLAPRLPDGFHYQEPTS